MLIYFMQNFIPLKIHSIICDDRPHCGKASLIDYMRACAHPD